MKRILSLLLLICLLLSALAGCRPNTPAPTQGPSLSGPTQGTDPSGVPTVPGVTDPTQPSVSEPTVPGPADPSVPRPTDPTAPVTPTVPGPSCGGHADADNNGICDNCHSSVLVDIGFFALNDLHGKFADTDSQPGVDEMTTYFKSAAAQGNVVLLASGDMWQGSSESNQTHGAIMVDWMNQLGFAAMTLGNHDFDWGSAAIAENEAIADFPFLAINVYDRGTNALADYCTPSVLIEEGGVQIGIIGAIGDCYSSIATDKSEDVYFKTGSALTALVKAESEKLRNRGADIIVYSIHDGYDRGTGSTVSNSQLSGYYDVSLSDGYVDLVFEGHTHQKYAFQDSYGVYHLQGGGENAGMTQATVAVNIANGSVCVESAKFVPNSVYSAADSDPVVDALLDKYADRIGDVDRVLGKNRTYRNSNNLKQISSLLYYEAGMERWGTKYDIVLGGGFFSVRSPYNLAAGDVTYADLQMLFPFDNQLVLCSIRGSDLKNKFFETNNSNYFISYGDYGTSVKKKIEPNKTYYIITDTYTSGYAPNRLTVVAEYDPGVYLRDLMADYVEAGRMG